MLLPVGILLYALALLRRTIASFRKLMDEAMLPDTAVYTFSHSDQFPPVRKVARAGL